MKSLLLKLTFCCLFLFGFSTLIHAQKDTTTTGSSTKLNLGQTQTTDEDWLKVSGGGIPTHILNGIYTLGNIGVNTTSPDFQFTIHSKGKVAASNSNDQTKLMTIGHDGTDANINTENAQKLNIGVGDNLGAINIGNSFLGDQTDLRVSGNLRVKTVNQNNTLDKIAVFDNNNTLHWRTITTGDQDWLKVGGGNPANISDKIYTLGSMGVGTNMPDNQFRIHAKGYIASTHYADQNKQLIIGHDGSNAIIRTKNAFRLHVGLGDHLDAMILGDKNQGDNMNLIVSGEVTACKINTSEVEVKTGWCDYVFEEDYDLMSLEETAEFIKQNKHLPKIPPAKEVEENGLQMAAMQVRMMEKIEELTLHVIQLNKKIKALEAK